MISQQSSETYRGRAVGTPSDENTNLSFDVATPTIKQIVSEILPNKIDFLDQHRRNVQTASIAQDQAKAKKEMIKGSLLVRQIKGDLTNLEEIKQRLHNSHHQAFDKMVNNIIRRATTAVTDFNAEGERRRNFVPVETESSTIEEYQTPMPKFQVLQHPSELEEMETYASSVEKIHQDCQDLHSAYSTLAHLVAESAEVVDKVEDNIVATEEHVKKSERHLAYCARKNLALSSIIGAFAGACVAGPVGLVIGAKVAAVTALGGGFLGYSGAQAFKKRQQKDLEAIDTKVRQLES